MAPRALTVLLAPLVLLAALSCSDPVHPTGSDTNIQVLDNLFTPVNATVTPGTTVTWTWSGSNAHNVVSDDGTFTASETQASGKHTVTFGAAGTYGYHCTIHGTATTGMRGSVVVQADSPGGM